MDSKQKALSEVRRAGDRVVHWCDLDLGTGVVATEIISRGAFGYPLNAFVSTESAANLGLVASQSIPENSMDTPSGSLLAVIVAAFDAESYLIWSVDQ